MTRPTRPHPPRGLRAVAAAMGGLALTAALAQTAAPSPAGIYTCIDDRGRRLTSDRPIPECRAREQRVLNRDGSLKDMLPPTLTPAERAAKEARDRREAEARAAQADAVRRDRTLVARYPDQAAHDRAREAALEPVRAAIADSARRMTELVNERRPLMTEKEFYVGRTLPATLQLRLDTNDAAMAAQRSITQTQEAELARVNGYYDVELDRLRQLWAGAPPGSIPQVVSVATPGPVKP